MEFLFQVFFFIDFRALKVKEKIKICSRLNFDLFHAHHARISQSSFGNIPMLTTWPHTGTIIGWEYVTAWLCLHPPRSMNSSSRAAVNSKLHLQSWRNRGIVAQASLIRFYGPWALLLSAWEEKKKCLLRFSQLSKTVQNCKKNNGRGFFFLSSLIMCLNKITVHEEEIVIRSEYLFPLKYNFWFFSCL